MTSVILRRRNWERASCDGIVAQMRNRATTIETGEPFPEDTTKVFRWGCTANAPVRDVVNRANAIHLAADKPAFRKHLREHAPDTIPKSWFESDGLNALRDIGQHYPVVVRPKTHERGRDFHLCNTTQELLEAIALCNDGWYISKFYQKAQEFRVGIVQGRVAFVVEKIPMNRNLPAWGLARNWNNVRWGDWPLRVVRLSHEAFVQSGLDFGAVDTILDVNGDAYVCEINSAPQLTGVYEQTKMAQCFDYIIERDSKETIPITRDRGNWKKFIHPALSREAILV